MKRLALLPSTRLNCGNILLESLILWIQRTRGSIRGHTDTHFYGSVSLAVFDERLGRVT